jgi:hypothetical protein
MQQFLRLTVERTLSGNLDQLKEYALGCDIYARSSDFDPRVDAIVRVEANRLRRKLHEYYETCGREDLLVFRLRPGSYVPETELAAR